MGAFPLQRLQIPAIRRDFSRLQIPAMAHGQHFPKVYPRLHPETNLLAAELAGLSTTNSGY
jgi:hypothetical protein